MDYSPLAVFAPALPPLVAAVTMATVAAASMATVAAANVPPVAASLTSFSRKPRVFILSDISNEPDDAESLVRYLLYANEFETEGLVATTSTWLRNATYPEDMVAIVDAYAAAVDNLNKHVHPDWQYPSAEHVKSLITRGAETYGMTAVGDGIPLSPGGELLYSKIIAPSSEPLWVLCWGGTNTLAQVLFHLDQNFSPEESAQLMSRIRVYTISDQDDSSVWIRTNYPDIFYIASIHGFNQYGLAAWSGISGDKYYGFDLGGPDFSTFEPSWVKQNIQQGPLGVAYPDYEFIAEGDSPSFLYLIQNGLGVSEFPSYGSWGGRYARTEEISSTGTRANQYTDTADRVVGLDGRTHISNQATIWRWRSAYQHDFAARICWTQESQLQNCNHNPVISVNNSTGQAPLRITGKAGATISLDASATYDPDLTDNLTFKWYQYREPSTNRWNVTRRVATLGIAPLGTSGRQIAVTLPVVTEPAIDSLTEVPIANGQALHLILEVTDDGVPALTSYRRVIFQVTNSTGTGMQAPVPRRLPPVGGIPGALKGV